MALRNVVSIMVFTLLASAGVAFAQTSTTSTTTVTTTSTSSTSIQGTGLGITLTPTERIAPGTQDALLALVLMTSGTDSGIQTSSLPLSVTFGGGLEASDVSDCRVRNVMSLATPLNATAMGLNNGTNTFSFSNVTIDADSTVTLAVTCDIAADAPLGGTALLSITPGSVSATTAGSGSQTSVTPVVGRNLSGGTGSTSGTVTISSTPTTPFIPGVPNTGSGPANLLMLALSGAIVAAGAALLLRRRYA